MEVYDDTCIIFRAIFNTQSTPVMKKSEMDAFEWNFDVATEY